MHLLEIISLPKDYLSCVFFIDFADYLKLLNYCIMNGCIHQRVMWVFVVSKKILLEGRYLVAFGGFFSDATLRRDHLDLLRCVELFLTEISCGTYERITINNQFIFCF